MPSGNTYNSVKFTVQSLRKSTLHVVLCGSMDQLWSDMLVRLKYKICFLNDVRCFVDYSCDN